MQEYRPCIVFETVMEKAPSENTNHLIDIKRKIVERKALFHCWSHKYWIYKPVMIGDVGGQMSCITAIVEYEDGTMHEHIPEHIRFTDGMAEKILEEKKDGTGNLVSNADKFQESHGNVFAKTIGRSVDCSCCDLVEMIKPI